MPTSARGGAPRARRAAAPGQSPGPAPPGLECPGHREWARPPPTPRPWAGGGFMRLRVFAVWSPEARAGEHVLYGVLDARYVGIGADLLGAIPRWSADAEPAGEDEREAQEALLEDGFLVRSRAEDDEKLR